jgi:hypothetical protein
MMQSALDEVRLLGDQHGEAACLLTPSMAYRGSEIVNDEATLMAMQHRRAEQVQGKELHLFGDSLGRRPASGRAGERLLALASVQIEKSEVSTQHAKRSFDDVPSILRLRNRCTRASISSGMAS